MLRKALVCSVLFVSLAVSCGWADSAPVPDTFQDDSPIGDQLLGTQGRPGFRAHAFKVIGGKKIYDVHYTFDEYSRRVTPGQNGKRPFFALLFGCSMTFGQGLEDDQTIAYFLSKKLKDVDTYTYAYPAYGAQQMIAHLQAGRIPQQVPEKRGVALYFFLDHHLNRTLGTLDILGSWGSLPYYEVHHGAVVRVADTLERGKPWMTALARLSWVKKFLAWRRFRLTDHDFDVFSDFLLESKRRFESQFPHSKFVVVLLPEWGRDSTPRLIPFLRKKDIAYLDYSGHEEFRGASYHIPVDNHPNSKETEAIADLLAKDLPAFLK